MLGIDEMGKEHVLHTEEHGNWEERWQWKRFVVDASDSFNKFRLHITENHGDPCTQLGQLRLFADNLSQEVDLPVFHFDIPTTLSNFSDGVETQNKESSEQQPTPLPLMLLQPPGHGFLLAELEGFPAAEVEQLVVSPVDDAHTLVFDQGHLQVGGGVVSLGVSM